MNTFAECVVDLTGEVIPLGEDDKKIRYGKAGRVQEIFVYSSAFDIFVF